METTKAIKIVTGTEKEWEETTPAHIFSDKRIRDFINASRKNGRDDKVYANVQLVSLDSKSADIVKRLHKKLKKKEAVLESIARQMRSVLSKKNEKMRILLGYIKLLENMLTEHNIDYRILKRKYKSGEVHLSSRVAEPSEATSSTISSVEYTKTYEIVLDADGNEIKTH
ncbi:MAG: hypothetical protein PF637_11835 [Spirochaetes bacterium]|jgi:hypothetical protein|nr:hypothetical protein [Spirochaetota bacterium]